MPSRVFPRLDEWAEQLLDRMRPPVWLESEIKQRLLLFLNHVLMQESSALDRLRRQQGRQVQWRWRDLDLRVTITPAGLLERGDATATPDLVLILNETSPVEVARSVLQGQRPQADPEPVRQGQIPAQTLRCPPDPRSQCTSRKSSTRTSCSQIPGCCGQQRA